MASGHQTPVGRRHKHLLQHTLTTQAVSLIQISALRQAVPLRCSLVPRPKVTPASSRITGSNDGSDCWNIWIRRHAWTLAQRSVTARYGATQTAFERSPSSLAGLRKDPPPGRVVWLITRFAELVQCPSAERGKCFFRLRDFVFLRTLEKLKLFSLNWEFLWGTRHPEGF
jgi:hypothetical protein